MSQMPTIGRIVNFVMPGGDIRAAVIVRVWTFQTVNLQVFTDGDNDVTLLGNGWQNLVGLSDAHEPRTWHWPVRA